MSDNKAVAVQTQNPSQSLVAYFPTESDWKMMLDVGTKALKSGMLPSGIKTPEAAAIIALKARELNMPIMVGFSHIHVINGKPTLSAEMMIALARKNLPGLVINIIESSSEKAEIEFIRPESGAKPYKISFTIEDAKRAELLKNPTWTKYPAAMLWSRCVSAGLRRVCPEAMMGVSYTPEELGANVDEDGNVINTTGRHVVEEQNNTNASPVVIAPKQSIEDSERNIYMPSILALLKELEIEPNEAQRILYEDTGANSLKLARPDQLSKFLEGLEREKTARATPPPAQEPIIIPVGSFAAFEAGR